MKKFLLLAILVVACGGSDEGDVELRDRFDGTLTLKQACRLLEEDACALLVECGEIKASLYGECIETRIGWCEYTWPDGTSKTSIYDCSDAIRQESCEDWDEWQRFPAECTGLGV